MHIAKGLLFGVVATGLGLALSWSFGCHDKPTEPKPDGPKDYVLYWNRYGYDSTFFGYHTFTGKLDTFSVPGTRIYDMNVSSDGSRVYISYSDKTKVVRACDFETIVDLPYSGWYGVAVSPDNRYIAVQSGNLRILSTVDYSLIFQDTLGVNRAVFSANGQHLYAPGTSSPCRSVYRLDLEHGFKSDFICVPDDYSVTRVVPSRDERFLFMFRYLGDCNMYFDVFDVAGDSLAFRDLLIPGCGDMVVSPDNRHVYLTGPGSILVGPPPPYTFARFSVQDLKIDSLLYWSTCVFDFPTGIIGSDLAITSDGHFLAISDIDPHVRLLLYDCVSSDTARVICLSGIDFWHLTCQNGR